MKTKKINLLDTPIIYINLDEDFEKNKNMIDLMSNTGFSEYLRISATKAVWSGNTPKWQNREYARACVDSFYRAFTHMDPPFLVLEDDVLLNNTLPGLEFKVPDDADVVYLGGANSGISDLAEDIPKPGGALFLDSEIDNVLIPVGMVTMHAVLVLSKNAQNKISKFIKNNENIIQDVSLAKMQIANALKFYAINPPIFYQKNEEYTKDPYAGGGA
jgi:hypothetical protein